MESNKVISAEVKKKFEAKCFHKKEFEERCFNLIIESYTTTIKAKVLQLDWDENDITAELHQHIEKNPSRIEWGIVSNIEQRLPKDGIKKGKGFANKLPRIDIRMVVIESYFEYEYHMEAKTLKEKDSRLKRRYIRTGINSFVSEKYENGCLLGYILEGNLCKTVKGINKLLKKDDRDSEFLKAKTHSLHNFYYESDHGNSFILKHFMFDFTLLHSA